MVSLMEPPELMQATSVREFGRRHGTVHSDGILVDLCLSLAQWREDNQQVRVW